MVDREAAVRVAVVSDAQVGAVFQHGGLERTEVGGAHAVVDVQAVRVGADDHDVRAGILEEFGGTTAGGPVRAVEHDLEAFQALRGDGPQVEDVAVLGVGEATDASDAGRLGTFEAELHLGLDRVFDLIRELVAAAGEELDAVVRRRVVGGGDHDAEVGFQIRHQEGCGRGGQHTGVIDVHTGAGEPGFDGGGDELATGPRITRDDGAWPAAVAVVMTQHHGRGLGQLHGQFSGQQSVRKASDAVGSK